MNPFPSESELYFPVVERDIFWRDKFGNHHKVPTHKTLVRPLTSNIRGVDITLGHPLAVVKSTYGLVQNKELFNAFEEEMLKAYGEDKCAGVQVVDQVSRKGAWCLRDYRFPHISLDVETARGGIRGVNFRTIVINGFGGPAIKVYTGGIDAFCTNGMIRGEFETIVRKHSSKVDIGNVADRFKQALLSFEKLGEDIKLMQNTPLHVYEGETVKQLLSKHLSPALTERVLGRTIEELPTRGHNVWALYSALTYFASNDNFVPVRETGTDHKAQTMLKREETVRRITTSDEWQQLLRAA